MKSWCERIDRDYTCSELIAVYVQSLKQTRKAVAKRKVKLEDLYVINADWADTRLNVKIGRGLTEGFVGMAAVRRYLSMETGSSKVIAEMT